MAGGVALATTVGTGTGGSGALTGCVSAGFPAWGNSTTRSEPVAFLAWTGGMPSAFVAAAGATSAGFGTATPGETGGVMRVLGGRSGGGWPGRRPMFGAGPVGALIALANACVEGSAGGRVWCGTVSIFVGSVLLWTKTFAWGLATMTRGGGTISRPEGDFRSSVGVAGGWAGGAEACGGMAGRT